MENGMNKEVAAAAPVKPKWLQRMTSGIMKTAEMITIYGAEGVGKSTFCNGHGGVLFLTADDGTDKLPVAGRILVSSWEEYVDITNDILANPAEYAQFTAVASDGLGIFEKMLWSHLCAEDKVSSIQDVGGGYGKGFDASSERWNAHMSRLNRIRQMGKTVFLIGHSVTKEHKSPDTENYHRYIMQVHEKTADVIRQWSTIVLFAQHETYTVARHGGGKKDTKGFRAVGGDSGVRYIYTERRPAFDAKNRHNLPPRMPLNWTEFWSAVKAIEPVDPKAIVAQIDSILPSLPSDAEREKVRSAIERAGDDTNKLYMLLDYAKGQAQINA